MGILASLAVPNYINQVDKARASVAKQNLSALNNAQLIRKQETGSFEPEDLTRLGVLPPKNSYYSYGVDPIPNRDGVFMRATPRVGWELKSYFAAVVQLRERLASIICESKSTSVGNLQKSDLLVNASDSTLTCRNNASAIK